ncbi:exopolysaccharide biosynthesis protein [Alteromonas aestuariivivens]|uniref:non-specific protein-tyrosine kinase n=1 Tax=Alteromonas aestuariivivens TaxID=1938339 RepID=A0A3D8MEK1_9ALTE|nr:XrtA-associated tyrosine autokinase [Alteromonas aestuariivivens]RDV29182.1 exopolysaccharide biosynthesis protein [Alteromonas aestuariivivens]
MSSTIEKALQRQQQAKRDAEKATTLEKAAAVSQTASEAVPVKPARAPQQQPEKLPETKPFEIDLEKLASKGLISLTGARTQINEEYREIKRKLIGNAFGPISSTLNNSNIIMVTSGRPSEGKTFTAANLALSIASEQDKTVLLVDADVLKPNVLNTLGLEKRAGLMEYLLGEVEDISDVLYHTNVDKLKIIPAGRSHHLSTELLASQKMQDTVNEFANRYPDRIVIFDTPPLIGITESAVLANFAGQAVVVTEEGKSKLSDIRHAVERLNPNMAIGFVVNKSVNNDAEGTGYYGYYYAEREE